MEPVTNIETKARGEHSLKNLVIHIIFKNK